MNESQKEEEKQIFLYSESYPLNENNQRNKVKPISKVHRLLSGIKIDPNKIYYKPLGPEHYEEVKNLHKEWFPVDYPEAIFSNCLLNNQGGYMTEAAFYFLEEENKEVILGLIICEWRWVDKFFFQFVGDNILEEINKSIDYEEEVQFFLSKQKFYTSVYIVSIGVIDECRKMNIGTNLIKSALNYAISFPFCVGIFLNVIVDNFSGKKFYEKNGLICSNRLKDFYVIEDKKYDSDVYVRIFNREKKNLARKYQYNFLNLKQKIFKLFIMEPFYFMVKLFLIFCLCRCFKRKIKYDK